MRKAAIVGIGRLGGALALALSRAGEDVAFLVHRSTATAVSVAAEMLHQPQLLTEVAQLGECAELDLVIITTGDPQISSVAQEIGKYVNGKPTVLHASGSLSSSVLNGLRDLGFSVGSIHPLVSVSNFREYSFDGTYFCVEGDDRGRLVGTELVTRLGGKAFTVDTEKKALYHAAAVMACGHLTALLDLANAMVVKCAVVGEDPAAILLPLVRSTIENIGKEGTAAALTGSFARGDAEAVARHLMAIEQNMDVETLMAYRVLGEFSLRLAKGNGLAESDIGRVRTLIQQPE